MDTHLGKCWLCKTGEGVYKCPGRCQFAVYCKKSCAEKDQYRHEIECQNAKAMLTCHECGARSESLKSCQGCFSSFYCGKNCQQKHWPRHKEACVKSSGEVMELAYRFLVEMPFHSMPWYISSSIAEDYLRLEQNEGIPTDNNLKLLFAGVGDIRDIIRTIADLPSQFTGQLQLVLNDNSPHIMARNLLIFYCAIVHASAKNASHFVQIWYSVCLSPLCAKFLNSILLELTTQTRREALIKMRYLMDISEAHWRQCCDIWKGWLRLSEEEDAVSRLKKERETITTPIARELLMVIRQTHLYSMADFLESGLLLPLNSPQRLASVKVNPTMTCFNPTNPSYAFKYDDISPIDNIHDNWLRDADESKEMIYCVRRDCYVFVCWDYLDVKRVTGLQADLMAMYKPYVEKVFTSFFNKMKESNIQVQMIIDDFTQITGYLPEYSKFDRICVGNLSDYFLTPVLLEKFAPLLNRDNPCSVLITHHQCWTHEMMGDLLDPILYPGVLIRAKSDGECRSNLLSKQELMWKHPQLFHGFALNCYSNYYPYFQNNIIADFVIFLYRKKEAPLCKSSVKLMPQVLKRFGVRLRDYRRELNHVIPFFREELPRRLTYRVNIKRHLEWVPC